MPTRSLREVADVSEAAMNAVYAALRLLSVPVLTELGAATFDVLDWDDPQASLLRHQILFTIERKRSGRWA